MSDKHTGFVLGCSLKYTTRTLCYLRFSFGHFRVSDSKS